MPDGGIPTPPYNIVIARMERRQFKDSAGALRTSSRPSAGHYHLKLACVCTVDPYFVSSFLQVPLEIKSTLTSVHKHHLPVEFQLVL